MAVRREPKIEREAERQKTVPQLVRPPVVLHDSELAAISELSNLLSVSCRITPGAAVDDEDTALRLQRRTHRCPEVVDPLLRHVRVPEGEEDDVEPLRRLPREDVRHDELGRR